MGGVLLQVGVIHLLPLWRGKRPHQHEAKDAQETERREESRHPGLHGIPQCHCNKQAAASESPRHPGHARFYMYANVCSYSVHIGAYTCPRHKHTQACTHTPGTHLGTKT